MEVASGNPWSPRARQQQRTAEERQRCTSRRKRRDEGREGKKSEKNRKKIAVRSIRVIRFSKLFSSHYVVAARPYSDSARETCESFFIFCFRFPCRPPSLQYGLSLLYRHGPLRSRRVIRDGRFSALSFFICFAFAARVIIKRSGNVFGRVFARVSPYRRTRYSRAGGQEQIENVIIHQFRPCRHRRPELLLQRQQRLRLYGEGETV